MDDAQFIALTQNLIEWIGDRFGRTAAWIGGVAIIIGLLTGAIAAIKYLIS